MTRQIKLYGILLLLVFALLSCTEQTTEPPPLQGPYLGQTPPGMEGELFAPGIMSTGLPELNSVFFPGGKEVIYSVTIGPMKWAMLMMKEVNGKWTKPEVAPFSGKYGGVDPFVSFDGNRIYYCSNRPLTEEVEAREDYDIWYVDRTEAGWSDPVNVGPSINSDAHEFYPALTQDGTMYFQSHRKGGFGQADIYKIKQENGKYITAEILPRPINSPGFEGDAFIAPDESYIIISTYRAKKNIGRHSDLYISFRSEDGSWSELINMGESVNSTRGENCQILSPCGKYLFYTSRQYKEIPGGFFKTYEDMAKAWIEPQNGYGDSYWVDAKVIEELKKN